MTDADAAPETPAPTAAPLATPASDRRPRSYSVALAALALAAALLFLASGRTWVTLLVTDPGLPSLTVAITGSELTYGAPLALLALAGIAGLVALRRVGRVVAGVVLVLCAVPAGVSVVVFATTHDGVRGAGAWIADIAGETAGVAVGGAGAEVAAWWLVELTGVALVALAGVLAVVASRDWPQLGRRYERDRAASAAGQAEAPPAAGSAWDQLDAGIDPTLGPAPGPDGAPDAENPPT